MRIRRRRRFHGRHVYRGPATAAQAPTSLAWQQPVPVIPDNSPWERAEFYRWRNEPRSNWLAETGDIPIPEDIAYQATLQPWNVRPIIGNHWLPVYYRTPPNNLVTDNSAHTGTPHNSITDGHYARFMPPPVSLHLERASRGEIAYRVPPEQDRGTPLNEYDFRPEPYTPYGSNAYYGE